MLSWRAGWSCHMNPPTGMMVIVAARVAAEARRWLGGSPVCSGVERMMVCAVARRWRCALDAMLAVRFSGPPPGAAVVFACELVN